MAANRTAPVRSRSGAFAASRGGGHRRGRRRLRHRQHAERPPHDRQRLAGAQGHRSLATRAVDRDDAALHLDVEARLPGVPFHEESRAVHVNHERACLNLPVRAGPMGHMHVRAPVLEHQSGAAPADVEHARARLRHHVNVGSVGESQLRRVRGGRTDIAVDRRRGTIHRVAQSGRQAARHRPGDQSRRGERPQRGARAERSANASPARFSGARGEQELRRTPACLFAGRGRLHLVDQERHQARGARVQAVRAHVRRRRQTAHDRCCRPRCPLAATPPCCWRNLSTDICFGARVCGCVGARPRRICRVSPLIEEVAQPRVGADVLADARGGTVDEPLGGAQRDARARWPPRPACAPPCSGGRRRRARVRRACRG